MYKLSKQAVAAVMMAVQKGMLAVAQDAPAEECDITQLLLDFELEDLDGELIVSNPPTFKAPVKS